MEEDPQEFIQQLLAMDFTKRGRPELGGAEMDRAAGMGMSARGGTGSAANANQRQAPIELENVVNQWAQGKAVPSDVRDAFTQRGWKVDLRKGRYDVEAYDPDGNVYYIQP